jgi:hypothetical protein
MRQWRVDLMQHHGGGCGGRALQQRAPVAEDHMQSGGAQRIGHHGTGNTGANDEHVAARIAAQGGARRQRDTMGLPQGSAVVQVATLDQ